MPRVIIRSSDIHAAGCFALENIAEGTRVAGIYRRTHQPRKRATSDTKAAPSPICLGLATGEVVIDGHGMAMFVNHSCDPNCETDEDRWPHLYCQAIRDIKAGEELTYDYWLYDGDDEAPCYCGSKKCRGSMYSPEEMKKLKPRRGEEEEASGAAPPRETENAAKAEWLRGHRNRQG